MVWAAGAQSPATERPSPVEIEREMDRTRADLAVTIAALRQQLAPPRMVERGSDMLDATLRKMKDDLDAVVRRHARWIGLLGLAGAGLGWLLVAQRRRNRPLSAPRRDIESMLRPEREPPGWLVGPLPKSANRHHDAGLRQTSGDAPMAGAGPDIASAVIDAPAEQAGSANGSGWSGETRLSRPRGVALDVAVQQPLVLGALALAAAAAVAILLPRPRAAEEIAPQRRDAVADSA